MCTKGAWATQHLGGGEALSESLAMGVQERRVTAPRGTHHVLKPGTNGG